MFDQKGITLMEIIFIIIIIGVMAALAVPNFTSPNEQARAVNVKNTLLAIYSAQKNYYNNHNAFCLNDCNSLQTINTNLSLEIPDDNSFDYVCENDASGFICTATRKNGAGDLELTVKNMPIQLTGATPNPTCASSTNSDWCL
jgi:type II secretory pathway pseudopilin PulG